MKTGEALLITATRRAIKPEEKELLRGGCPEGRGIEVAVPRLRPAGW
jgi:hypothetical protein